MDKIKGKVILVGEEWRNESGSFWKQDIVMETGFRFPNPIKVTFKKEHTAQLAGVFVGCEVEVEYLLNGREYGGKYYVDIVGISLAKIAYASDNGGETEQQDTVASATSGEALAEFKALHGDDIAAFAAFCGKVINPGKPSKEYTPEDWAAVVNSLREEAADKDDPLPF